VLRALFLVVVGFAALVAIDPNLNAEDRELTLRLRNLGEMVVAARQRIEQIGDLVGAVRGEAKAPAVAAPPPDPGSGECFTPDERKKLGKLVEETTR